MAAPGRKYVFMIEKMNQFVAYMCPACGAVTGRTLNIFDFSGGSSAELCCGTAYCKKQAASITPYKDKYKIAAECPICCTTHELVITKSAFWSRKYLELCCPESGIKLFFAGDAERINKAIKEQERTFSEISSAYGDDGIVIDTYEVLEGMNACNEIHCECGSDNIAINLDEENERIILICRDCRSSMKITPSDEELERILDEGITIKKQV